MARIFAILFPWLKDPTPARRRELSPAERRKIERRRRRHDNKREMREIERDVNVDEDTGEWER